MKSLMERYVIETYSSLRYLTRYFEIFQDGDFPGVMSTVQAYVDLLDLEIGQKAALQSYLLLIKQRAEGMHFLLFYFVHR